MMDLLTSYYTILSTILAVQVQALFPLFVILLVFPPKYIESEFPAPRWYKETGTRVINVQKYPAARDILLFIAVFLADIILLYPYIRTESQAQFSCLYRTAGSVFLCLQFGAAAGWSSIRSDWLAAERNFGLWRSKPWAVYYMTFILTSLACCGPLLFVGCWAAMEFAISELPHVGHAFYHAYKPLLPAMGWPSFGNQTGS